MKAEDEATQQHKATLIKVDGTETVLDHQPTLEEAQNLCGGWIDIFRIGANKSLVWDEEGNVKNKPRNPKATDLAGFHVVGDVILLEGWRTVK